MKTVAIAASDIVVGDIIRRPVGSSLYHLVEYVSLGDHNDIHFVCDTGRINVTRDDFVYRLAHSTNKIRDAHSTVDRGDVIRLRAQTSPATELGEYLKLARESGLRVHVDAKFGNDHYDSVIGSWPALQRFASNVLTRFVRMSAGKAPVDAVHIDVDVDTVMEHFPDHHKAFVSREATEAVLTALKASFESGGSTVKPIVKA